MLYLVTQFVIGTTIRKNVTDSVCYILLVHLFFQGGFSVKEHLLTNGQ